MLDSWRAVGGVVRSCASFRRGLLRLRWLPLRPAELCLGLVTGGYLRERWFSPLFETALDLKCALAFTIECNERSIR